MLRFLNLQHPGRRAVIFLGLLNLLLLGVLLASRSDLEHPSSEERAGYPELAALRSENLSFGELSAFFTKLADAQGAVYAFDALGEAPLLPNIDVHLLAHHIGDVLYRQQGLAGIRACTQDFRNACSHTIVIGLFGERGEAALAEIADACRAAPGGSGAYTMCFHGLGHGVLAYTGYDLARTIELCRKTGTPAYRDREYVECVGGVVMELLGGGGHDRERWFAARSRYLSRADPLTPCSSALMPAEVRPQCYTYLTPRLFEAAGADLGSPKPKDFAAAFRLCDAIPNSGASRADRDACFGGFGKEFVVLAPGRDIRRVERMGDAELARIAEWCLLADDREGAAACLSNALQSIYWGGENDRDAAIRFCAVIGNADQRSACFRELIGAVGYFISDYAYRRAFCAEIPASEEAYCRQALLGS